MDQQRSLVGAQFAQLEFFRIFSKKSNHDDGGDIELENPKFTGRWAGDKVYLVGDYDESNLYETAKSAYHNTSKELAEEYNKFVRYPELKLLTDQEKQATGYTVAL